MATAAVLTPVELYLSTSYRPDCDFVNGEVKERNWGSGPHSFVQTWLAAILRQQGRAWGIRVQTELRTQVRDGRYRVPDLLVQRRNEALEDVVTRAPLLIVEILSPEDRFGELQERVSDYATMGVEHIWAIDPVRRLLYRASTLGFQLLSEQEIAVGGTPIRVPLAELWEELDEALQAGR